MEQKRLLLFGTACCLALNASGTASGQTSVSEDTLDVVPIGEEAEIGFQNGSVIAVPIPFSNPTLGTGLALGGAWLFNADEGSGTSLIGLGGLKSDNGSTAFALGGDISFLSNRYLASILIGEVDLRYDFTAGDFDVPLEQTGQLARIDLSYGFTKEFSVGVGFRYAETTVSTDIGDALPPEISDETDYEIFKLGVISQWDARDSDVYPTSGTLVTFDAFRGDVAGGAGRDYNKAVLQGSHFWPVVEDRDVLAVSGTLCQASSGAPFFDACSIGLTDGLRGFSITRYIGESLASAQAEYRGRFGDSAFGYAAFVGGGQVGGTQTSTSGAHGAAGLGLRYRLSNDFPVDFAADVTTNTDGETLYYIYVGQSF